MTPDPGVLQATIAELIVRMRDVEGERRRRWPEHPLMREWARELAVEGRLLVPSPNWDCEVWLDGEGRVTVRLDNEDDRPANALETHLTWQTCIPRTWTELVAFVPPRPADAVACAACGGEGLHFKGKDANTTCICGNAGWCPPEAVGLDFFGCHVLTADELAVARRPGSPDAVDLAASDVAHAPPERRSPWQWLVRWFAP